MSNDSVARKTLWPTDSRIVLRVCFLYVGQGSSILVLVREGGNYRVLMIDSNLDEGAGGIDLPAMLKDLLPEGKLYAYVNTHPHDDHLKGLKEIKQGLTIENVWHSGHIPTKKYGTYHPVLKELIEEVKARKGEEIRMEGSKTARALFDAEVHFLAPAGYVNDEVNEEDAETRYRRIHENCAVLRFGKTKSWVLVTGDADLTAFKEHITEYHKDRLSSYVLDASHHGSRSFFKDKEEDEPYMDALKAINPQHVVISAPTQEESKHDHPHKDAVKLYEDQAGKENVLHTGKDRCSFIVDIFEDGSGGKPTSDNGDLAAEYGLDKKKGGKGGDEKSAGHFVRPEAAPAVQPRRYA